MRIGWLVAGWALGSAVRRLSRRTGVTDADAFGALPGDDVIAHPMVEWTRGVTVQAPPERIWPWLVQMGYGRAGWSSPPGSTGSWSRRCSSSRPPPQKPRPAAGGVPVAFGRRPHRRRADYRSYWRVLAVQPQRAIVYRSVRHPWRPHPFDPSDPAAVGRVEQALIAGGIYLDCT